MIETRPLRAYAEVALGRQRSPEHESGVHITPYLRAANVKDGSLDLTDVKEMNFEPSEQATFALRTGDVLVTEGSGSLSSVGASAIWSGEIPGTICFQNTLLRLRPRPSTDASFLGWWCRHAFADGLFASIATGANIFHVSADRVRSLPMTYVIPDQQRAIAAFLDTETARIDAVISRRRRMIDLVESRFSVAVIHAVTGSQVAGPRRQSSVEWIGDIPESWGTPWLGANFHTQLGKMLNAQTGAGPEQFPYVRNTNVQWDRFELDDLATMHFGQEDRARCQLQAGDLLVCEGGEVGRSAVWPGEPKQVYFQKAIHRVRPLGAGNTRFLMYCLRAAAHLGVFAIEGNQSTIVHLTGEKLREHRFPFPPPDEQQRIVEVLDVHRDELAETTRRLREQISLLQERRQALITAAVTGQLEITSTAA